MSDDHTEAAIWAEGTPYKADELLHGWREWLEYNRDGADLAWWCENIMHIPSTKEDRDGVV